MRRRGSRLSGFTAIEASVATSGTVIILMLATFGTNRVFDTYEGRAAATEVERMADQSLDRVVDVLADAGSQTIAADLSAPLGGSAITFQQRKGYASGAIVWGPETKLGWVSDPKDPRDDVDNDGDGLVDEGEIVMVDEDGRRVVLVRGVAEYAEGEGCAPDDEDGNGNGLIDEQGFSLEMDGRRLIVRITLARQDGDGEIVTRTSQATIALVD